MPKKVPRRGGVLVIDRPHNLNRMRTKETLTRRTTRTARPRQAKANTQTDEQRSDKRNEEEVLEPEHALPPVKLKELPEPLQRAAARMGWKRLMPVQSKTIPYVLAGRDLMIQSRTGSGKTGAFVLPILARVDPQKKACQALILAPTRELALQVADQAETLAGEDGVRSVAVYGGVGYGAQVAAFKRGVQIVVGTPGRILDHLLNGALSLKHLRILVFDEADRMLSIGFYPDMKRLQQYLPKKRINGYMFSATFTPRVLGLAGEFLHEPEFLSLSRDHVHVTDTDHAYYTVPDMDKDRCLIRIIEVENPASALVFCNTRQRVHYVAAVLRRFGYDADELTSDLSQAAREKVLTRVREGKLRFLAATDVAARGIDLPELSHVIQYEPPEDPELYVHRAGRTGRAGASGEALALVTTVERLALRRIGRQFGIAFRERPLPTEEEVAAVVSERATALLEAQLRDLPSEQAERIQQLLPLAQRLSRTEEQARLMALLLDEHYEHTVKESLNGEWELDEDAIRRMLTALDDHLQHQDNLQTERLQRFIPLATELAKEEAVERVAMLLDHYYQRTVHGVVPPLVSAAGSAEERRGSRRSTRSSRSGSRSRSSGRRKGSRRQRR